MRQTTRPRPKSSSATVNVAGPNSELARFAEVVEACYTNALALVSPAKIEDTARQWFAKTRLYDGDEHAAIAFLEALVLAGQLLLFTPSLTGVTPVERFVRQRRADAGPEERPALDALAKANFRLLRFRSRVTPATLLVEDVATHGMLTLYDQEIPDGALGASVAARIAPLPDGSFMILGSITPLDAAALLEGLSFVREGRGLSNPERCAAALYKHVLRHGSLRIEGVNAFPAELLDDIEAAETQSEAELDDLDRLAFALEARTKGERQEPSAEELSEARRLTSFDNLAQALTRSVRSRQRRQDALAEAFSELAFIMMETYERRAAAGAGGEKNPVEHVGTALGRAVAEQRLPKEALALFESLRVRLSGMHRAGAGNAERSGELTRVLLRIQALRAKTVEQGCTEQEALASAKKVAELLDRYGLSLGEVEMREQTCEGVGIETGRKRRAPLDDCVPTIALFCDCKVWIETTRDSVIRYVFFGLPLDVEAAHYLYDLIALTFASETARYKREDRELLSSPRRDGARSFQIGLAHGISDKLKLMKAERDAELRRSTGRDLVPVKTSVIEGELEKLGLNFYAKSVGRKRRVATEAYEAGRAAGKKFIPRRGVEADAGA
jgi:hypothetical protein